MKEKIYEYLKRKLYPTASCSVCQFANLAPGKKPCNNCFGHSKFRFGKNEEVKLKNLTDGICDLISEQTQH